MPREGNKISCASHRRIIVVLSLFAICQLAVRGQVDSTYISSLGKRYGIYTYFGESFIALSQENKQGEDVVYRPNAPFSLGIGVSWGKSSLGFSYGFDFMRDKKRGDTKTNMLAFQYHYYSPKFIADIYFQDYKGLYTEDDKDDEVFYYYPDIRVTQYGALWQYVFDGKKMSYRAAYNQTEKQLKSAGSFHLGGGAYYSHLQADSSLVVNEPNEPNKLNNIQIGLSGGYGYTWVASKNFYVSGSISVGVNMGAEYVNKFNFHKMKVYPSVYPRMVIGYNKDTWSLRMTAMNNRIVVSYTDDQWTSFNTGSIQITFVKRFGDIPILSKAEKKHEKLLRKIRMYQD